VRVEIMGSPKCRIVGKSQSVLVMINSIIFTRTRTAFVVGLPKHAGDHRPTNWIRTEESLSYLALGRTLLEVHKKPHVPRESVGEEMEKHSWRCCCCCCCCCFWAPLCNVAGVCGWRQHRLRKSPQLLLAQSCASGALKLIHTPQPRDG
jgi:hypothetical protein